MHFLKKIPTCLRESWKTGNMPEFPRLNVVVSKAVNKQIARNQVMEDP